MYKAQTSFKKVNYEYIFSWIIIFVGLWFLCCSKKQINNYFITPIIFLIFFLQTLHLLFPKYSYDNNFFLVSPLLFSIYFASFKFERDKRALLLDPCLYLHFSNKNDLAFFRYFFIITTSSMVHKHTHKTLTYSTKPGKSTWCGKNRLNNKEKTN